MAKKLEIRLVRSACGRKLSQRSTIRSLGLRKINSMSIHDASPAILGMVRAVAHLVEVKEID
ncbi:MAG: 50S ribosomal protein L30 [Spirochaetes bacterium]|nr:50S ribosomal protein L30 [Spirochaetota bacterium]